MHFHNSYRLFSEYSIFFMVLWRFVDTFDEKTYCSNHALQHLLIFGHTLLYYYSDFLWVMLWMFFQYMTTKLLHHSLTVTTFLGFPLIFLSIFFLFRIPKWLAAFLVLSSDHLWIPVQRWRGKLNAILSQAGHCCCSCFKVLKILNGKSNCKETARSLLKNISWWRLITVY